MWRTLVLDYFINKQKNLLNIKEVLDMFSFQIYTSILHQEKEILKYFDVKPFLIWHKLAVICTGTGCFTKHDRWWTVLKVFFFDITQRYLNLK